MSLRVASTAHLGSAPNQSAFFGSVAAGMLLLTVLLDLLRKLDPDLPFAISGIPLALSSIAALVALLSGVWRLAPAPARAALSAFVLMVLFSGWVAVTNNLVVTQIAAGVMSFLAVVFGAVLGHAVRQEPRGWERFRWVVVFLLCLNCGVVVLQQFGLLEGEALSAIEGAHSERGSRLGIFTYATGLFRTAGVFIGFICLASVTVCFSPPRSVQSRWLAPPFLLGLCLIAGVLTARRSGFLMSLGAIVPYVVSSPRMWGSLLPILLLAVMAFVFMREDASAVQVASKFEHMQVPEGLDTRVSWAFDVRSVDWALLSVEGDGLGSHRFAARAAGEAASLRETIFFETHPITHYAWFTDLLELGIPGAALHLVGLGLFWFALLTVARRSTHPGRWSAFGYASVSLAVYYFVSSVQLLTLTNGILAGLAIGIGLRPPSETGDR